MKIFQKILLVVMVMVIFFFLGCNKGANCIAVQGDWELVD